MDTSTPLSFQVQRLSEYASLPVRCSTDAAGYDLSSAYSGLLLPSESRLFKTDIAVAVPKGFYGRVAPRSGLAFKNSIGVLAGVIDSDYRGNVGVILINHHPLSSFEIHAGDRIAQLILEKIATPDVVEVDNLSDTFRGTGGFGSTGLQSS